MKSLVEVSLQKTRLTHAREIHEDLTGWLKDHGLVEVLRTRLTIESNSLGQQNLIGYLIANLKPKLREERQGISNPHTFLEIAFRIASLFLGLV